MLLIKSFVQVTIWPEGIGIFPLWKDARRQVDGFSRSSKPESKLRPFSLPLQWCLRVPSSALTMLSSQKALPRPARLSPLDGDFISLIRQAASLIKAGAPSVSTLTLLRLLVPFDTPITLESLRPWFPPWNGSVPCLLTPHCNLTYTRIPTIRKNTSFSQNSPALHKGLIQKARHLLGQAHPGHALSLVWTKAHTTKKSIVRTEIGRQTLSLFSAGGSLLGRLPPRIF